jgi:hypothetical protein
MNRFSKQVWVSSFAKAKQANKKLLLALALCLHAGIAQSQNYTGPWYNAAESGWGLNIVHQGNVLFPTWFTYDTDGKPLWLYVSGAAKQADGSYTGDIYRTTGAPFNQISGTAVRSNTKLGTAKLSFASNDALNFTYTLANSTPMSKTLSRLAIGAGTPVCEATTASRASATNYSDIWHNASENGWGINLFHQDDLMFATWFTYGANGRDSWYMVSRAQKQADGSFTGAIQQVTSGTPYTQINGAPAVAAGAAPDVGNMTFRFTNGERGSMTYTIGAVTQTKAIEREVFASPQQVCRSGAATPVGGGGMSANGNECFNILALGQTRRLRQGTASGPFEYSQRGLGAGTFEGKAVQIIEIFNATGVNGAASDGSTTKQYVSIVNGNYENVAVESFNAAGALTKRTRYTGNQFPIALAVGTTFSYAYSAIDESFIPPQPSSTVNHTQKYTRLPDETVAVPAGSFANACKLDIDAQATTTAAGLSVSTRLTGPGWFSSAAGGIKIDATASSVVNGIAIPPDRQLTELIKVN